MNVPLLDLKKQYQTIKHEVEPKLLEIFESQMLILGKEVDTLEKSLADYCNVKFTIGVSSGTDALLMALMALDIKPGDEVIVPTYSFFATAGVVARLNAIPVFIDSDPKSFNINPDLIETIISNKTKAIIPVHLYGQSADMEPILELGRKHNIPVIEDCAQAIGTEYKDGSPVGSMALMGCYSFYPTKNLGGFGDGGFISTNDEQLAQKLKQMRNHGMEPKYWHSFIGGNFRLDAIQAAVLNIKLKYLEDWHKGRRENANLYSRLFIEKGLASAEGKTNFDKDNKVLLPAALYKKLIHKNYHIYNQYIIQVEKRDELRKFLSESGIGTEIYYPVPFHRQPCFAYLNCKDSDYPVANSLSEHTLALPIFPELEENQIEYVVGKIKEYLIG